MNIPKEFKLFGKTYRVKFDNELLTNGNGAIGEHWYRKQEIKIKPSTSKYEQAKENVEHTFLHEVVHAILGQMNETELNNNEKFVDVFSNCLHQVLSTSKGELKYGAKKEE